MCSVSKPKAPSTPAAPKSATALAPDRSWLMTEARSRIARGAGGNRRSTVNTALQGLPNDPAVAARNLNALGANRNPRTPTVLGR